MSSVCNIDIDVGTAVVKLLTKSIQATIMGSLGPFVLYFGADIGNIVCLVQASLIADFAMLSYQFEGFCPAKLPIIAKTMVSVGMSTIGVAFGMIKDKGFRATSQGISLAMIVVTPLMGSVSKPILEATDQETCAATPDFPGGAPCGKATSSKEKSVGGQAEKSVGGKVEKSGGGEADISVVPPDLCELPDLNIDAMFSLWFVAGLPTLTALCFGKCASMKMPKIEMPDVDLPKIEMPDVDLRVAADAKLDAYMNVDAKLNLDPKLDVKLKPKLSLMMKLKSCKTKLMMKLSFFGELLVDLSFAFTGTYMTLKAFIDLGIPIWQIADPCGAEAALPGINAVITTLTYAVGGASFFLQRCRKQGRGADKKPKGLVAKINAAIGRMAGEGKDKKKGEEEEEKKEEEKEKKKQCEKCGKKCLHCDPPKRKAVETQTEQANKSPPEGSPPELPGVIEA